MPRHAALERHTQFRVPAFSPMTSHGHMTESQNKCVLPTSHIPLRQLCVCMRDDEPWDEGPVCPGCDGSGHGTPHCNDGANTWCYAPCSVCGDYWTRIFFDDGDGYVEDLCFVCLSKRNMILFPESSRPPQLKVPSHPNS